MQLFTVIETKEFYHAFPDHIIDYGKTQKHNSETENLDPIIT
jgi:hypothetical protein